MNKRVLIVEDHMETADAIADFIRFAFDGWTVEHTMKGDDAVQRCVQNPPDVMVLDIALADEVNGLEVIKRLWHEGVHEKPRIVVNTALGNRAFRGPRVGRPWMEQLNEQEKTLVHSFFEKPYSWHAFLTAIAKAAGIEPPEKIQLIPKSE